jgi:hypothetical protein
MRIIDVQQGTDAWRLARAGLATASEFGAILARPKDGKGEATTRRNYRARLVVERLSGQPVSNGFESFATRQGTEREPSARAAYEITRRAFVSEVGVCVHDEIECGASPDGFIGDDGGVEIKSPELATHIEYLRRTDAPPEYKAQIQGNLWITGRRWWDFVSFNPDFPDGLRLVVHRVLRDEPYIKQLDLAVRLFMDEVRAEEAELRKLAA